MKTIQEIDAYLDSQLSANELSLLEAVHWRYMRLCGIVQAVAPSDRLEADKITFRQYIKRSPEGDPIFDTTDCIAFMSRTSGIPLVLCEAWLEKNFLASILEMAPPVIRH